MKFKDLYNEHYKLIYSIVFRFIHNKEETEDICQETFLKLYEYISNGKEINNVKSWLITLSLNNCKDKYKKQTKYRFIKDHVHSSKLQYSDPDSMYEINEKAQILSSAIDQMPQKEKEMLILYQEGMSYKEIGEICNVNYTSVGKTLSRVILKLKKKSI
ncbi:MAG: RNA polymerase sigma factor [Hyphomicrobiales bacterium]